MKTLLTTQLLILASGLSILAQKPVTVKESNIAFKNDTLSGFVLTIPEVSFETIETSWTKVLQSGTKSKVQEENGELSIFGAIFKSITEAPINVFSRIKDKDTAILLSVIVELKKDEYVNSENHNEESVKIKDYLFNFGKEHYLSLARDQLQVEEKKLSKLENELSSQENEQNKMEKMIKSNNTTIGSIRDELVTARSTLESLNSELLLQNSQISTMEEGPAKEQKVKYADDLEKRIRKTNKDIESGEKKTVDLQAEITKAQNNGIPESIREQERLKNEINAQKKVAEAFTIKFNTIKDYAL